MSTKLSSLTQRARRKRSEKFTSLMQLLTVDFLRDCFLELKRDRAPGVDGVTVREYEVDLEERLLDLVARLKSWRYRPQPVRRVYIPKPKGGKRPLGIPAVEDKVVCVFRSCRPLIPIDAVHLFRFMSSTYSGHAVHRRSEATLALKS